jgi:uncharacterized protein YndB with AHSA1/START domain
MADPHVPATDRVIDLSVEVAGTPEEVWAAVATGPGISSWFVPTTIDERVGGATTSTFGEGPEMLIPGVVAAWEPPHRVRFESAAPEAGMAFEWLVEARGQGTCVVRLINGGFGSGEAWDAQFDGMSQGWLLFLHNLQLHRAHFPGRIGVSALPMAMLPGPRAHAWATLLSAAGLTATPSPGERVRTGGDAPALSGTVVEAEPWRLSLLVDEPAPGTAFLAAEGDGDQVGVSVWLYLYGPEATAVAARQRSLWQEWLGGRASAG